MSKKGNSTANNKGTAKPRGKPFPKGVSGNPAGAPKRGESWADIIKRIGDMTPVEAADHAKAIANKLRVLGDGLTMKEAVVMAMREGKAKMPATMNMRVRMSWKVRWKKVSVGVSLWEGKSK